MLGLTSTNEKTTERKGLKFGYNARSLKPFDVRTQGCPQAIDTHTHCKEVSRCMVLRRTELPQPRTVLSNDRSRRRMLPLRMSVRALMMIVLILGGMLAWVVHLAHAQRDAVAAIRSAGGQATYDWQLKRLPNGVARLDPKARPWAPSWLLEHLGPDYFGHVEDVTLETRNADAVMKQVEKLDKLRVIRVSTGGIDVAPLARAGLESLPNVGLTRFKGLFELVTTGLNPPEFNGKNFKYLRNMTRLETLQLPGNIAVTDADLAYLSKLTALLRLELHDPRITDAGLVSLKDMTRLNHLALQGSQVSGAGLIESAHDAGIEIPQPERDPRR